MFSRDDIGDFIWHSFQRVGISVQPKGHELVPVVPDLWTFDQDETTAKVNKKIHDLYHRFVGGEIAPCQIAQDRARAKEKFVGQVVTDQDSYLLVPIDLFSEAIETVSSFRCIMNGETGGSFYYKETDGTKLVVGYEHNPNVIEALVDFYARGTMDVDWIERLREARQGKGRDIDKLAAHIIISSILPMPNFAEVREDLEHFLFYEDLESMKKADTGKLLEILCQTGYLPSGTNVRLLGERTQYDIRHHTHPENSVIGPSEGDMKIRGLHSISRLSNPSFLVFYQPDKDFTKIFQYEGIEARDGGKYAVLNLGKYRPIPNTHEASQSVPLKNEALIFFREFNESAVGLIV